MKRLLFILLLLGLSCTYSQERLIISSSQIPREHTSLVFIPKDYDSNSSYPLLFMLHGHSGNYNQWNEVTGGLQSYADRFRFVIVCPDGFFDSWYLESPEKNNSRFESFFFGSLVPKIFEKYKIDKGSIFITGLSMGGHGAITLMLKRPDFFKSAGSTSGILDITAFPDNWGIKNVLGNFQANPEIWKQNSALYLLGKEKLAGKQIIFDCGTDDFAYEVNKAFYEKCLVLKVKATFISQPGAHTGGYWKSTIDNHFRFFSGLAQN